MDVERTIQFLLDNAAQAEARAAARDAKWAARDAKASARMDRLEASQKKAHTLVVQLIGLMSQQTAHQNRTDKQVKETSEAVNALTKRIDAFVAASLNGGRHRKDRKNGHN